MLIGGEARRVRTTKAKEKNKRGRKKKKRALP